MVFSLWFCPECLTEYLIAVVDAGTQEWVYEIVKEGIRDTGVALPITGIVSADAPFCMYDARDLALKTLMVAKSENGTLLDVGVPKGRMN